MTTQHQPEALPPLPEPYCYRTIDFGHGLGSFHRTLYEVRKHLDSLGKFGGTTFTTEGNSWPMFTADQMRAYATEHAARLHAECEELRADAERGAYVVRNGGWIRSERDGCAYLTVRLPLTADLSCVATRRAAIDAARAAKEQA